VDHEGERKRTTDDVSNEILDTSHGAGEDRRTSTPPDNTQRNLLIAGAVLVAVAVVVFIAAAGDDNGGSEDNSQDVAQADLSCKIGAAGMTAVAQGLSRGQSVRGILLTVGAPIATNEICRQAINTWVKEPEEPVDIDLATPQGTEPEVFTGTELATPVQEPTDRTQRAFDCLGWSYILYRLCVDGQWPTYGP
jgi:hypothetical protein